MLIWDIFEYHLVKDELLERFNADILKLSQFWVMPGLCSSAFHKHRLQILSGWGDKVKCM